MLVQAPLSADEPRSASAPSAAASAGAWRVVVVGFGLVRGTWAVGGSDSSCYALMADAFARGELQPHQPSSRTTRRGRTRRVTFAPAGFIPSPVRAGAASPICAPGFSLAAGAIPLARRASTASSS